MAFAPWPMTLSTSRKASSDQPMFLGYRPLTMTLWLTTVSEAMSPTQAFL